VDVARRTLILAASAALLLPILGQLCAPPVSANMDVFVNRFSNGSSEALIGFPVAGMDDTLKLSIQTGMRIYYAYFNITGVAPGAGSTDYLDRPALDLGGDESVEWRFNGTGYGSLGHQTLFSDGNTSFSLTFDLAGGTNDSMALRFPAQAKINSAAVTLTPSGFSGPLNVSLDIGADGSADWSNTALLGPASILAFESVLSAYISSAVPSGTDVYNNSYVDVPLRVSCGSAATLSFVGLSISYSCTLVTGNLGPELDQLIPDALGTENVTIPLVFTSASSGRLRIWDIRIKAQPPSHSTSLLDTRPAPDPVMDENTGLNFSCSPVDIYGNPFSMQWYLDDSPILGANGSFYLFFANFSSSGRHMVMVSATNGLSESQYIWSVTVRNVNRAPVLDSSSPSEMVSVAETSTIVFNVSAHDPDGDQLSYSWRLDGHLQPEAPASFSYHPSYGSVGQHTVDVAVQDSGGMEALRSWCVTVLKTNVPPVISSFSPAGDVTIREGDVLCFSIVATDINWDLLSYEWVVDGFQVAQGMEFNFTPDFSSSGIREIRAVVTDGEFTVLRSWSITVLDVNHPPIAQISAPLEGAEMLDTDIIRLAATLCSDPDSDNLALSWSDGNVPLGNGSEINVTLIRGHHEIRLVVDDGRGGRDTACVNVTVRCIRLNVTARASQVSPVVGDRVKTTIWVISEGDAAARDLSLDFFVDGVPSGSRSILVLEPGANLTETFLWTAERGNHELLVIAGNHTVTINVKGVEAVSEWFYPGVILLATLILSVGMAAGYFTYLSIKGAKPRGRRARKRLKRPWYWLGTRISEVLERIRLEGAPFRDRPLVIQTTVPEGVTSEDLVAQQLTAKRKWWLRRQRQEADGARMLEGAPAVTPGGSAPAVAADGSELASAAEGAFSSSTTPVAVAVENGQVAPESLGSTRDKEEPPAQKKPRKRIKDIEDRILALERKGADVASVRRFLSLGRSFWKGGNAAKADQYFDKAEIKLHQLEEEVRGIPLCPSCGATVESAWMACPECETKLQ
jgi:hypothetical protein